ncbi:hypothetical protein N2152v2_003092 [Parachlorella kessleri]
MSALVHTPLLAQRPAGLLKPASANARLPKVSNGTVHKTTAMQVWTPLRNKFFETFSYLPPLTAPQIAKQVDAIIENGTTPCLEFSDPNTAYVDSTSARRMGDVTCNYYDNRYWTMWKLPMFGCTDPGQVLQEVDECTRAFPNAYIRLVAFDATRQVQITGFLVHRPESSYEHRDPSERSVGDEGYKSVDLSSWNSGASASRGRVATPSRPSSRPSSAPVRPSSRPTSSRPSSAPVRPSSRPVSAPSRPAPSAPARPSSSPRPSSAPIRPSSRPVAQRPAASAVPRPSSSPRPSSRVVTPVRQSAPAATYSSPAPSYSPAPKPSYTPAGSPSDLARMLVLDREVHAALKRANVPGTYHLAALLLAPARLRPSLLGIYESLSESLSSAGSLGRDARDIVSAALASISKQLMSGGFDERTAAAYALLGPLPKQLSAAGVRGDSLVEFVGSWLLLAPDAHLELESKQRLAEYVKETAQAGDSAAVRGLADGWVSLAREVLRQ